MSLDFYMPTKIIFGRDCVNSNEKLVAMGKSYLP